MTGKVESRGFTGPVLGVRVVQGTTEVASAPVAPLDGSFTIEVPRGTDYRLEVVTRAGVYPLGSRDSSGLRSHPFDVCDIVPDFDLGDIRHYDDGDGMGGGGDDCRADGTCGECDPDTGLNCDPGGGGGDDGMPPGGGDGDDCGDPCDPETGICDPCLKWPELCDPCWEDPSLCDPCALYPEMCDPCWADPSLCDPCLARPELCCVDPCAADPAFCCPPDDPMCIPPDPCEVYPEMCDPCLVDPSLCDPCALYPEMCDPCWADPSLCDPCLKYPELCEPCAGGMPDDECWPPDPCEKDPSLCDPCVEWPEMCDPCWLHPEWCEDPCAIDPSACECPDGGMPAGDGTCVDPCMWDPAACDPCIEFPELCEPCEPWKDPSECYPDPCREYPEMCDPCRFDPDSCWPEDPGCPYDDPECWPEPPECEEGMDPNAGWCWPPDDGCWSDEEIPDFGCEDGGDPGDGNAGEGHP